MGKRSKYVIDAGVLALYFAGERSVKKYFDEILRGAATGYLCEVNLAEFFYKTAEKLGLDVAEVRYEAIRNSPIIQVPAEGELTREAARVKAKHRRRTSLADAYLIAVARQVNGLVLTTDSAIKEILKDTCKLFRTRPNN